MTNVTATAGGRHGRRRVALVLLAIVAVLAVILAGGAMAYAKQYDGKALPGTTVLGQDVSGKSAEEIAALVAGKGEDVTVSIDAGENSKDVSLADLGVAVDAEGTAAAALDRDRAVTDVVASTWSGEHAVQPVVTVDEAKVAEVAKGLVPEDRTQPVDAKVEYDEAEGAWKAVPGTDGQGIDPSALVDAVTEKAASLESFSVTQPVEEIAPAITTDEAEKAVADIGSLLDQPMSIKDADGDVLDISSERRSAWLSVAPDEAGKTLEISVDEDAVRDWVAERAEKRTKEAKDGIEQVDESGKTVKVVAEKQDGVEITNTDEVADQLIASLQGSTPFEGSFDRKTLEAEIQKVDAPKTEDESEDDAKKDEKKKDDATAEDDEKAQEESKTPTGEKWIDVNLSDKTVTAYVGDTPVWGPRSMVDGKEGYETVEGSFEVYLTYEKQDMTNASRYPVGHEKYYYTEDVPWVQYFHGGYAFHGAPWRSSFGYSGSHGCINLPVSDAKWLYDWGGMGTRVEVHR